MNKIVFTLTVIATFLVMSCSDANFKSPKEVFTTTEVSEIVNGDVVLVDVRNVHEIATQSYNVKTIIHIPLDSIEAKMDLIPKDKQVILVCQSGNRSRQAFALLKQKGFANIANMEGGMNAWSKAGFSTKSDEIVIETEKKACCANPNSKDCNLDGTCKVTTHPDDRTCCVGSEQSNCVTAKRNTGSSTTVDTKNRLEVYAFHGTRQCETCKNMKTNTKATLDRYFKDELKSGKIVYQIIDVDDAKNEKLAEKFQATGTALMINKVVNGKDNISDWSDFAFDKANDANVFMPEFKSKITKALK